ncbi:hypothetical protein D0T12_33165 [Actinomadura spongiicola]|uniref:Uncharacterized protein n=1 Tax=Actinomadura spongiicola TaxID=2303421 RepID=A0A372G752_9ACTN|nr:hypothetical protein [Actinomadura spongiicola]RFS81224.1 hypothetical protein D0T12_33165 [Actinomadura spongiicola]
MTGASDGYEIDGDSGTYVITDPHVDRIVGAYYAESAPGWWRGVVHGRVRRLFVPCAGPLDVAARMLRRQS